MMAKVTRSIKVVFDVNAVHCWKDCPFDEVAFLRDKHHHKFIFTIELRVTHSDRDKEFIMLQNEVRSALRKNYPRLNGANETYEILDFGTSSCEQLAEITLRIMDSLGCQSMWKRVEVSEDGFYSGIVEEEPLES